MLVAGRVTPGEQASTHFWNEPATLGMYEIETTQVKARFIHRDHVSAICARLGTEETHHESTALTWC